MCSLAVMSAELLVGRSPPATYGGHHFFCANSLLATAASQSPTIIGSSLTSTTTTIVSDTSTPVATVNRILRPCLSSGLSKLSQPAVDESSLCKNNSNQSTTNNNIKTTIKTTSIITTSGFNNIGYKQKKKVVFADDRGRPLTQVRVMSDTLYPLPQWMQNSFYLKDFTQDGQTIPNLWTLSFQLPASDYLTFKNKLEQNAVCLEHVTITQKDDACLSGTVKVKNLAYDKQVIIRATYDHWTTHEDIFCTYVDVRHQVQAKNSNSLEKMQQRQPVIHNLYDTFRFQTYLPLKSDCVEFCVCYRVNETEYWDNNDGKNYSIRRQPSKELSPHLSVKTLEKIQQVAATNILLPLSLSNLVIDNQCVSHQQIKNKPMEKTKVSNMRAWSSEFTYWQYVNDDRVPYW